MTAEWNMVKNLCNKNAYVMGAEIDGIRWLIIKHMAKPDFRIMRLTKIPNPEPGGATSEARIMKDGFLSLKAAKAFVEAQRAAA